jgi:hypothetical protein
MGEVSELVRREIELYRQVSEAWKADHDAAIACYDFHDLLGKGIAAFESISRYDEEFRRRVFAGQPFDAELNKQILELYRMVSEPCQDILDTLARFERAGFKVDSAERFRSCCRELEGILSEPRDFFSDDSLVKMRDEAIDANRRGDVSEYSI